MTPRDTWQVTVRSVDGWTAERRQVEPSIHSMMHDVGAASERSINRVGQEVYEMAYRNYRCSREICGGGNIAKRTRRRCQTFPFFLFLWLSVSLSFLHSGASAQQDDGSQYVKEVLEDDASNHDFDNAHMDDEEVARMKAESERLQMEAEERQQEEKRRLLAEEEKRKQEATERLQQQMDAAFEVELDKMTEEQQKMARKQKKQDTKTVKRILAADRRGNLYGVLGLRNLEIRIPSRQIKLAALSLRVPGFNLFRISSANVKKAFRLISKTVHPDKNRDARAGQAFMAVENAAQVLSTEDSREAYDLQRRQQRDEVREKIFAVIKNGLDRVFALLGRMVAIFRKVLGPFTFPVFLLGIIVI